MSGVGVGGTLSVGTGVGCVSGVGVGGTTGGFVGVSSSGQLLHAAGQRFFTPVPVPFSFFLHRCLGFFDAHLQFFFFFPILNLSFLSSTQDVGGAVRGTVGDMVGVVVGDGTDVCGKGGRHIK